MCVFHHLNSIAYRVADVHASLWSVPQKTVHASDLHLGRWLGLLTAQRGVPGRLNLSRPVYDRSTPIYVHSFRVHRLLDHRTEDIQWWERGGRVAELTYVLDTRISIVLKARENTTCRQTRACSTIFARQ